MTELNHSQVAEAMWELFQNKSELRTQELAAVADDELKLSAVALMATVSTSGWGAWRAAPAPVRATAAILIMDFFNLLISGDPSVATRFWSVTTIPRERQALEVIAQELMARPV